MRVESPATFPKISTNKTVSMHPHQSIFYDSQEVLDEEIANNPEKKHLEEYGLPQLYSMKLEKKIYNSRLCNDFDNLGSLVKGITKDITDVSKLTLDMQKYGLNIHNVKKDFTNVRSELQVKKDLAIAEKAQKGRETITQSVGLEADLGQEGLLGRIPDDVESLAELMLQDSDVNVYQQSKVKLKEEGFTIRGKKQKTAAQKQQAIRERKHQAWMMYKKMEEKKKKRFAEDPSLSLLKPTREMDIFHNPASDVLYRPPPKEV